MNSNSLTTESLFGRFTRHINRHRVMSVLSAVGLLFLVLTATVSGLTTLSQGYITSDKLSYGSIVSLQENTTDYVNATTSENADNILGVVINEDSSLLTLSTGQPNQVQVATSGIVQVLVSDLNGDISQGDQITASPIPGVGMKATANAKVVGIAQGDLNDRNGSEQKYKDKAGKEYPILIGETTVLVSVSYFFKQPEKTIIPSAVQNVANALAGKKVDSLPVIISLAIFVVAMIAVVSIIYATIKSSIISVGRNPMSQSAIYRNLIQISALVLAILGVAVVAIYLVLTRL